MAKLGRDDVLRWRASLEADGLQANSVRSGMAYLSAMLEDAQRDGLVAKNAAWRVPRPKETQKDRFLTPAEVKKLKRAAPPWLRSFVQLALSTGCRPGELLKARWEDMENGALRIPAERCKGGRTRHIRVSRKIADMLGQLKASAQDGFVLAGPRGAPLSKETLCRAFKAACREAGVEGATPHTLRHTVASWLAQDGESLYMIGELLGHASTQTTRRYAHLAPEHLRSALARLDRLNP